MAFRESLERLKKRVEKLSGDVKGSRESVRGIFSSSRPTPVRDFIRRRTEKIKGRKRLGLLERKKEE